MMWIAMTIVILILVVPFFYERSKMIASIKKKGGMEKVHAELIALLSNKFHTVQVLEQGDSYIIIGTSNYIGYNVFEIIATFSQVTIKYKIKNHFLGVHNLEWSFFADDDPGYISYKINSDIEKYFENLGHKIT